MLRLRESTNDRCAVLWLYLRFVSLNIPLCLLHKKVLVSRHAYNKLALFKNNNTSHAHLFWTEVLIISSLNEGTISQTIFLSVFIKILKFITGLINDHLPHFPKINSGMRPSHLLTKVDICGGMRMQLHTCYKQACHL